MNKVVIFYGSNRAFMEILPKSYRNLTDVVMELDKESKNMILHIPELNGQKSEPADKEDKKLQVDNFVINSDEYCGVREHVIINFANFIAKMDITNMYIQNPPTSISEQLHRIYDTSILQVIQQKYNCIDEGIIKKFNNEYGEKMEKYSWNWLYMPFSRLIFPHFGSKRTKEDFPHEAEQAARPGTGADDQRRHPCRLHHRMVHRRSDQRSQRHPDRYAGY